MSTPAIELTQVTKRFGAKVAVRGVSLHVRAGDCYGLIGPNGAGKTTTFALLCGFLHPTEGTVRVLGEDPGRPGALKGKVGALPQDAALPPGWKMGPLLVYWAKLSGLPAPETEAREALAAVGLEASWSAGASDLSHGMAKRVGIAQALMGRPPLVLLDEPTAGLDPKVAALIRDQLLRMKGHQTVVVSSHNLSELEALCDATAILDRGQLVKAATLSELTSKNDEFQILISRGDVPLEALRALPGCSSATLTDAALRVRFDSGATPADEMISRTLSLLLQHEVRVLEVTRGRRLEERVLQLT